MCLEPMVDHVEKQLQDHEERIRDLEKEATRKRRMENLEERVRRLELTQAKLVVLVGISSFGASSLAHWVFGA